MAPRPGDASEKKYTKNYMSTNDKIMIHENTKINTITQKIRTRTMRRRKAMVTTGMTSVYNKKQNKKSLSDVLSPAQRAGSRLIAWFF